MKKNKKKVVFFDLEATGLDVAQDRICSIAVKVFNSDMSEVVHSYYSLINPCRDIPQEVSDIHGITNVAVKDSPTFQQAATEFKHYFVDTVIVGYNILQYDLALLQQEFHRANMDGISGCEFIDAATIFKRKEERTLSAALKFFCSETMEDAHNAQADVDATIKVFNAELERYYLSDTPVNELASFSNYDKPLVDFANKLTRDSQGYLVYNFGKAKGKRVRDDVGFADWMLNQSFITNDTKKHLITELNLPF